jgi:hypothetical protein
MSESNPDHRAWRRGFTSSGPRALLAATQEELTALDDLLRDHLETLSSADAIFRHYLDGKRGSLEWEDAYRKATRSRVAYERKRDAILVRTGRI